MVSTVHTVCGWRGAPSGWSSCCSRSRSAAWRPCAVGCGCWGAPCERTRADSTCTCVAFHPCAVCATKYIPIPSTCQSMLLLCGSNFVSRSDKKVNFRNWLRYIHTFLILDIFLIFRFVVLHYTIAWKIYFYKILIVYPLCRILGFRPRLVLYL